MDLFGNIPDKTTNLLPFDGTVLYYGRILSPEQAHYYYRLLTDAIDWKNDEAIVYGKKIITRRKVAWYGDLAFRYSYSNTTKYAQPWIPELLELKRIVEKESKESYNSCLLNLYHNGTEGMAWHSDAETDLKKNGAIASLSLGAERKFALRHKGTGKKVEVMLCHGSLLIMKDTTQTHWLHCLPVSGRVKTPRISLTFRTICLSGNLSAGETLQRG